MVNRARRAPARTLSRGLAESLLNPFEISSCIPDAAVGVGCFSVKIATTIGTGTGTSCGLALQGNPDGISYRDNGSAGNTPTISGNWSATNAISAIATNYDAVRIVSFGLRMSYIGNTQTDGGVILVGQVGPDIPLSQFNGASLSNASAYTQYYKTIPLRNGAEITWRPTEMDDQAGWQDITSNQPAVTSSTYAPYLIAFVYGATTAQASLVQVDYVVNFEGRFSNQTYLPGGVDTKAAMPKAEMGWYESTLNLIRMAEPIVPVATNLISMANGLRPRMTTADGARRGF